MISSSKIAKLANLPLTAGEAKDLQKKLSETLDYISKLNKVDTARILPTYQTGGKTAKLREDIAGPSLTQEEALKNANRTHNGFFVADLPWG